MERLDQPEKKLEVLRVRRCGTRALGRLPTRLRDAIANTASEHSPWYVVPADNKWFSRLVVGCAVVDAIAGLKLHYPIVGPDKRKSLARLGVASTRSERAASRAARRRPREHRAA